MLHIRIISITNKHNNLYVVYRDKFIIIDFMYKKRYQEVDSLLLMDNIEADIFIFVIIVLIFQIITDVTKLN